MPLVRVRIVQGTAVLGSPTKPFVDSTTVQVVLEKALVGISGCTTRSLDVYPDAGEKALSRSQFEPEDFGQITVGELALNNMGLFWVVHVEREAGTPALREGTSRASPGSPPAPLPDSLDKMMQREAGQQVTWPPVATGSSNTGGSTFEQRIFNALVADLRAQSLGFHFADAGPKGSGTMLLKALSRALQYAIPFDIKGTLGRRAMHIPDRFKANELKVHLQANLRVSCADGESLSRFGIKEIIAIAVLTVRLGPFMT